MGGCEEIWDRFVFYGRRWVRSGFGGGGDVCWVREGGWGIRGFEVCCRYREGSGLLW